MIGKTISHYKILEKLGEGGMGVVYKAHDTTLDRVVALKFLPHYLTSDPIEKERFYHEAKAASSLNHPNITTIHEITEYEKQLFIAMEYVEGKTLKQLAEHEILPLKKVLDITIQVCDGLIAAHEKGIVHRDIKSENIMLTPKGQIKIMDFGLAKVKGATKLTKEGSTLGTAAYMSPEQAQGEEVDHRSDNFSFGVVLYELLTGKLPFRGEHHAALVYSILNEEPQPVARFNEKVTPEIERIIYKALAKNKDERYQHVDDMLADLRHERKKLEYAKAGSATAPTSAPMSKPKPKYMNFVLGILLIIVVVIGIYIFYPKSGPTSANSKTIAVLPFANLSGNHEDEYFTDGIMEDILTQLQKIGELKVISRTTMIQYKGTKKSLKEIGIELNAGVVLEGSVRRSDNRIRITSQLIDAETDKHLWADTYDREMKDIFAIQSDVANSIASALKAKYSEAERKRIEKEQTVSTEAYQLYLKGRYFWNKRQAEDLQRAIDYFNQALEKDPAYALAYTGLASTYVLLPEHSGLPPNDVYPKATACVNRALQLDSTLAEPHAVLGLIKTNEWDWSSAEREYKKAIELNPSHPTTHQWYNLLLRKIGRISEALAEIKRAEDLDPLSVIISINVGLTYRQMRQYDKAIAQIKKTQVLDPNYPGKHFYLGMVYAAQGNFEQAVSEIEKDSSLNARQPFNISCLGHVYGKAGKKNDALRMINKLLEFSKEGISVSTGLAFIYIGIDEKDKAFQWLEKAYNERSSWMRYLVGEPLLDDIRSDPRFIAFLEKMGLKK